MWNLWSSSKESATPQEGRILDRRTMPPGVMPRHLQQWLVIGVAVAMIAIMALSGGTARRPTSGTLPSDPASVINPNQQRIEEYERRIQEQAQRLAAEQAQLELTRAAVDAPASAPTASEREPGVSPRVGSTVTGAPVAQEPRRVADNVAYSREAANAPPQASSVLPPPALDPPAFPPFPSLPATMAPLPAPPLSSPPSPVNVPSTPSAALTASTTQSPSGDATGYRPASAPLDRTDGAEPRYRLYEGTFIDTVLTNRLDGTYTGPVNCLVSTPVYASDYQRLVIPAGARVLGEARAINTFGQSRLAVTFHRILLPNGARIDLNQFHGLNQVGDLGLRDQVNRHYAQIFGASLALGAIAGFAQGRTSIGIGASGVEVYRQGVAASVSESSARVLDRFLNLLPTVTIREGHRIKVYLSSDLELPAYRESIATGARR